MDEMKYDMGGAAMLGSFRALAELELPLDVVGLIPACENRPAARPTSPATWSPACRARPSRSSTPTPKAAWCCDALTYAERFKPSTVIDIATLTGACVVALGHVNTGLFSQGRRTGRGPGRRSPGPGHRMAPAHGRRLPGPAQVQLRRHRQHRRPPAGAVTAACFLSRFTKAYRWAHLDIAGTAWKGGKDKGATGRPVPLLMQFLLARLERPGTGMTRIDFAFGAPDRLRTACQVARKRTWRASAWWCIAATVPGWRPSDRMLWAFDDISFVPHVLANDPLAADTPVVLTASDPLKASEKLVQAGQPQPWLLNLDDECPPGFEGFERLLEIVSDEPDDKQAARQPGASTRTRATPRTATISAAASQTPEPPLTAAYAFGSPHAPHSYDPGIPTLTQRVEPPHDDAPASVAPPRPAAPVGDDDAFPVLTEIAPDPAPPAPVSVTPVSVAPASMPSVYVAPAPRHQSPPRLPSRAMPWTMPASAPSSPPTTMRPSASAEASVLAARLQAEVEQLMRAHWPMPWRICRPAWTPSCPRSSTGCCVKSVGADAASACHARLVPRLTGFLREL